MNEQSLTRSLHLFRSEEIYRETEKRVDDDDQYTSEKQKRRAVLSSSSSLLKEEKLSCTCIYIYIHCIQFISLRTLLTMTRN
jgi:hypothetical protein